MTRGSCNYLTEGRAACGGKTYTDGAQTKHALYSAEEVCLLKKTTIYVNEKLSETRLNHFILLYQ